MNVLILTPDAVGSTLLQRLLTVQMVLSDFDKPVINLHELTNGLMSYYNSSFNMMCLGRQIYREAGYYQSLNEIVELLESTDHYKTSRLAHYHILNRKDPHAQQIEFYKYLNDNFFIITARRKNVFEYALSWGINNLTKRLNVYNADEKLNVFYKFFKEPVYLDEELFKKQLEHYKQYIIWTDTYFRSSSYYTYEEHMPQIEDYILNLPIFSGRSKKKWNDVYGLTFKEFNICNHSLSDLGTIALNNDRLLLTHDVKSNVLTYYTENKKELILKKQEEFQTAKRSLDHMQRLGMIVSTVPVKKLTLAEKKYIIKNFDNLLYQYNDWALKNTDIAQPYDQDNIKLTFDNEKLNYEP